MILLRNLTCILTAVFSVELCASMTVSVKESQGNITLSTESGDFGNSPEVIIHDDFDSGTAGLPLQNWTVSSGAGNQNPAYSNASALTGKQSGMSSFLGTNYNSSAEYKSLPNLDTVYLSYYFKVDHLSGEPSRNIKLARLSGGHTDTYIQAIGMTIYDNYSSGQIQQASIDYSDSKVPSVWTGDHVDGKWHRIEKYIKLSNPPKTANGITIVRLNGRTAMNHVNVVNEESGMRYRWLTLPYYVAHDPGGDYKIYFDNVVVSKNQARVELCNNDVYADCKQPVIAKLDSWTAKSITINKESISAKHPYSFIFNEANVLLNTKGVYYCLECPQVPKVN